MKTSITYVKVLSTAQQHNDKGKQADEHDKPNASVYTDFTSCEVFCRIPHESIPGID